MEAQRCQCTVAFSVVLPAVGTLTADRVVGALNEARDRGEILEISTPAGTMRAGAETMLDCTVQRAHIGGYAGGKTGDGATPAHGGGRTRAAVPKLLDGSKFVENKGDEWWAQRAVAWRPAPGIAEGWRMEPDGRAGMVSREKMVAAELDRLRQASTDHTNRTQLVQEALERLRRAQS